LFIGILNVRHASPALPEEFTEYYNADKYAQSQKYLKENTLFSSIENTIFTLIIILFIFLGGFNFVDRWARNFQLNFLLTGLTFAAILVFASQIMHIPFSAYHTFVIEGKYGFNKTSIKTFITDILKKWFLTALLGGISFSLILWFFNKTGQWAWFYCWIALSSFQLFLSFIAPVIIIPLFYKFIPLEDGELKNSIESYAKSENFKMKGIFKIDASRRSTKTNAFFTGFGKYRRIALFDTLIEKHTVEEIVSILAHEIGHYRKKHIVKSIILSIFTHGLMFFILSLFINNPGLFAAFRMEQTSIYASLFFFGFLYTPISILLSVLGNILSRKHEYEADQYAISTYQKPESFIIALKKLTVDNLGNLTPHPLKVFLEYSHPPVLARIQAIKKITSLKN
jgi:STE24 endopeptidase